MTRRSTYYKAATLVAFGAVLAAAAFNLAYLLVPERMVPSRYVCVVRSLDGCVAWADPVKAKRYLNAEAGT